MINDKKNSLVAYKESLFKELEYLNKRIADIQSNGRKDVFFQDSDSTDSEGEFCSNIDIGPSIPDLKQQQTSLRTCLQATQELTNLQVVESEVNVLTDAPAFQGEPPVLEPGVWREVTAECRVDLVPFCITFFVHQPNRSFAPLSYRGLHVTAVKSAHEAELKTSILPSVRKPSDATEILKSYSAAHRSRRTTLARLAEKFPHSLYMEPMAEGGFHLKCADLLEVSWCLQNKWSPVAQFHHRMKFDLEFMDESYLKIITQTHRQLSDPAVDTDERTFLLSKIISTCLEAQGPTQELYESMSSDPETAQSFRKRRTTLDREPEVPVMKKKRDEEVMAPPKSLPKKAKPKGKENINKDAKGRISKGNVNKEAEKVKGLTKNLTEPIIKTNARKDVEIPKIERAKTDPDIEGVKSKQKNVAATKNKEKATKLVDKKLSENGIDVASTKDKTNAVVTKNKDKVTKDKIANDENKHLNEKNENVATTKSKTNHTVNKNKDIVSEKDADVASTKSKPNPIANKNKEPEANVATSKNKDNQVAIKKLKSANNEKTNEKTENDASTKNKLNPISNKNKVKPTSKESINNEQLSGKDVDSTKNKVNPVKTKDKPIANKPKVVEENVAKPKNVLNLKTKVNPIKANEKTVKEKKQVEGNVASVKNNPPLSKEKANIASMENVVNKNNVKNTEGKITKNVASKTKNTTNPASKKDISEKENTIEKVSEKHTAVKRKSNVVDRITNSEAPMKKAKTSKPDTNTNKKITDSKNALPQSKKPLNPQKTKIISGTAGNTDKFSAGNTKDMMTKIPQMKMSSAVKSGNPLRISPYKLPPKFKTADSNKQKAIQKSTNIPRLLKKPSPKAV